MGDKSCNRAASRCGDTSASLRMTDPMARKNENVAALLSMYWERVARNPRGPGPALRILYDPKMNPIVSPTPPPISAPILEHAEQVL